MNPSPTGGEPALRPETSPVPPVPATPRIASIDALRGLVMFTMIFVNDLAGAPASVVPWWMRHFPPEGNGMTFVDLVFPAFLFIVGLSIPFALGPRLDRGEPVWRSLGHVLLRTLSLLFIGILMVNETPGAEEMGWSATAWVALMYLSAILAFSTWAKTRPDKSPPRPVWRFVFLGLRLGGLLTLVTLAFLFRGEDGHRIITLSPFSIHTDWYGILGLIGWAYLVGALVFYACRNHPTATLACAALLLCLYPADRTGVFGDFWLGHYVGIGETLGSQASITVAGMLLASTLVVPKPAAERVKFTLWFIAGFAAAALLLDGLYGINKNNATPSWCLWACAISAGGWLVFYLAADVLQLTALSRPFVLAGQNVLLAYLLSEGLGSFLEILHLGEWYDHLAGPSLFQALSRSAGCALAVLTVTVLLNRLGFRLKL